MKPKKSEFKYKIGQIVEDDNSNSHWKIFARSHWLYGDICLNQYSCVCVSGGMLKGSTVVLLENEIQNTKNMQKQNNC